jgi:hypothetical protein
MLGEQCHASAGGELDIAPIRFNVVAEDPHQRRLAGPVAAQQSDPLAGFNLTRHSIEQNGPAKADFEVVDRDLSHL